MQKDLNEKSPGWWGGGGGGGEVLPYIDYMGRYCWIGYGCQAIWSGILLGSSNHRKLV